MGDRNQNALYKCMEVTKQMQGMLFYQNKVGNKEEIDLKIQLTPILHFVLLNSHFIRTLNKFYSYC